MQTATDVQRHRGSYPPLQRLGVFTGLLALALPALLHAETALQPGEELTYSVRWAVLPAAGQIRIAAAQHVANGEPRLSIATSTETRGLARRLMSFQAHSESIYDVRSGRLITLQESSTARAKHIDYSITFDHDNHQALFSRGETHPPRALELPEGDPADLITTLMKTRLWDLKVGEARDVLVSFRDEFYELTVHAVKMESVKTSLGEFETLVLEPRMEKSPPKGMFKRGANVRVWVSQDQARLPVRFQVDFKVGTGIATLVKYVPPTTEARIAAEE
jgi:hypothetical protein